MTGRLRPARRASGRTRRGVVLLLAVVAGLGIGTGTGWAYFSTTGHGAGTAQAGRLSVQVLDAGDGSSAVSAALLPGEQGPATIRVHNTQPVALTLLAVTATGPARTSASGCDPAALQFHDQAGLALILEPGSTQDLQLPDAVSLSVDAGPGCQGASFRIPVSVTVRA